MHKYLKNVRPNLVQLMLGEFWVGELFMVLRKCQIKAFKFMAYEVLYAENNILAFGFQIWLLHFFMAFFFQTKLFFSKIVICITSLIWYCMSDWLKFELEVCLWILHWLVACIICLRYEMDQRACEFCCPFHCICQL